MEHTVGDRAEPTNMQRSFRALALCEKRGFHTLLETEELENLYRVAASDSSTTSRSEVFHRLSKLTTESQPEFLRQWLDSCDWVIRISTETPQGMDFLDDWVFQPVNHATTLNKKRKDIAKNLSLLILQVVINHKYVGFLQPQAVADAYTTMLPPSRQKVSLTFSERAVSFHKHVWL